MYWQWQNSHHVDCFHCCSDQRVGQRTGRRRRAHTRARASHAPTCARAHATRGGHAARDAAATPHQSRQWQTWGGYFEYLLDCSHLPMCLCPATGDDRKKLNIPISIISGSQVPGSSIVCVSLWGVYWGRCYCDKFHKHQIQSESRWRKWTWKFEKLVWQL